MATKTVILYYCEWPECGAEIPAADLSDKDWTVSPRGLKPKPTELCKAHRTPLVALYGKRNGKRRGPRPKRPAQ